MTLYGCCTVLLDTEEPADFITVDETLLFTDTISQMCVLVQVVNELTPEFDEAFSLMLSTDDNLVQFSIQTLVVTIPANDCECYSSYAID